MSMPGEFSVGFSVGDLLDGRDDLMAALVGEFGDAASHFA
jgi:hypothetical protein